MVLVQVSRDPIKGVSECRSLSGHGDELRQRRVHTRHSMHRVAMCMLVCRNISRHLESSDSQSTCVGYVLG